MLKKLVFMTVVSALVSSVSMAQDSKYFEITKVKLSDVTEQFASDRDNTIVQDFSCSTPSPAQRDVTNPLDQLQVWVDQIINIGQKIWNVVVQGKPVVNLKLNSANALPKGVSCWTDLQGWSAPKAKVYNIQYENAWGVTVVDFSFRVSFISGGNYQGQGQYITNATVSPAHLTVQWGFSFDAEANVPVVFNQGTSADPTAGMQLDVNWKVNSVLSHMQDTESFFLNGAGQFQQL